MDDASSAAVYLSRRLGIAIPTAELLAIVVYRQRRGIRYRARAAAAAAALLWLAATGFPVYVIATSVQLRAGGSLHVPFFLALTLGGSVFAGGICWHMTRCRLMLRALADLTLTKSGGVCICLNCLYSLAPSQEHPSLTRCPECGHETLQVVL